MYEEKTYKSQIIIVKNNFSVRKCNVKLYVIKENTLIWQVKTVIVSMTVKF